MSQRKYLTLSDDLDEAAEILLRRRHYRSFPEYVTALIRYDAQTQKDHHLTEEWAAMDGEERDALDAKILQMVKGGRGVRGSWLLARLETILEIIWGFEEKPTADEIAKELAKREKPPKNDNGKS